ncbi:putative DNA-binding transcriptional regulator YafY [Streptomyces sp. SAI-117]|uniref:helix-turn-helix transcriptional regulator n=1 Tax=Streptomyces sp. SAI-117 TaxID=2940546 RepID=UPI002473697A|nr:YafY family protein [Streptomyces sp. SAI-117]MDH6566293.1 putative DNA-binding transcriptional regulator YafY [Streptomyces sp. SAI-117]
MRADRLLSLLLALQSRGRVTARQLAAELEVSVRTVYRDLQALSSAGVPVVATGGPGGGCRLLEGWRSPLLGISAEEATALLAVASGSGPLERIALGDALAQARLKLLASLPAAGREQADTTASRFHIDTQAWFRPPERVPHLAVLVDAVRRDRRLRLTHASRPGATGTVDPLGLVAKAGVWYLVVRSDRGVRTHRASRITDAELLAESFDRPADFDLAAHWARWTAEFEASLDRLPVTVRLTAAGLAALPQVLGDTGSAARATADPAEPGRYRLVLHFDDREAACRRLLGFGPDAEVLEPVDVREQLADMAHRTAARYRNGADPMP